MEKFGLLLFLAALTGGILIAIGGAFALNFWFGLLVTCAAVGFTGLVIADIAQKRF